MENDTRCCQSASRIERSMKGPGTAVMVSGVGCLGMVVDDYVVGKIVEWW